MLRSTFKLKENIRTKSKTDRTLRRTFIYWKKTYELNQELVVYAEKYTFKMKENIHELNQEVVVRWEVPSNWRTTYELYQELVLRSMISGLKCCVLVNSLLDNSFITFSMKIVYICRRRRQITMCSITTPEIAPLDGKVEPLGEVNRWGSGHSSSVANLAALWKDVLRQ